MLVGAVVGVACMASVGAADVTAVASVACSEVREEDSQMVMGMFEDGRSHLSPSKPSWHSQVYTPPTSLQLPWIQGLLVQRSTKNYKKKKQFSLILSNSPVTVLSFHTNENCISIEQYTAVTYELCHVMHRQ